MPTRSQRHGKATVCDVLIISLLLLIYLQLNNYNVANHNVKYKPFNHSIAKRGLRNLTVTGSTRIQLNSTTSPGNTLKSEEQVVTPTSQIMYDNGKKYVSEKTERYTFATLLCDDKLLQATSVLVYSMINYAGTSYPVTIMALPNVTQFARNQLRKLGAHIIDINMLEYPFKVTPARLEQNKPCRYSKLQLWNMTQFDKIVYMDSDMMALKNIDSIFEEYSELSAVVDAYPGIFNTGIFVLEPNETTYNNLISTYKKVESYNVGDQGYLNWYFGRKWRSNTSYQLPLAYNVLIKYKDSVIWPTVKDDLKVVHFTAETKPWNIHYSRHSEWKKNSDPVLYFKWMKTRRQIDHIMGRDGKFQKLNAEIDRKCEAEVNLIVKNKNNLNKRFSVKDKFSVVLSTFDRTQLAIKLVRHYSKSEKVDRIFLLWHNPKVNVPKEVENLTKVIKSPPVYIIKQRTDSLNNKFNPIPKLRTEAVLIADDDMVVDVRDIDYAFSVWQTNPYSIVGNFPRFHRLNRQTNSSTFEYHVSEPNVPKNMRRYSIMLTKFMFIRSEYLFWYTCLLPECIHAYIDDNMNCEDIAMQMLASGMTNTAPVAVNVLKPIADYGTVKGISALAGHLNNRGACMDFFHQSFGNKNVLIYNNAVISRFEKIPFFKVVPDNNMKEKNN